MSPRQTHQKIANPIDCAMSLASAGKWKIQIEVELKPDTLIALAELAHVRGEDFNQAFSYLLNVDDGDIHFYEMVMFATNQLKKANGGAR